MLGTELVKNRVSKDVSKRGGCSRVLISTIAFGMGVNRKQASTIIHFGPFKNIKRYIQAVGAQEGMPVKVIAYHCIMACFLHIVHKT